VVIISDYDDGEAVRNPRGPSEVKRQIRVDDIHDESG